MTDHAEAAAEALEKVIAMLRAGQSPEDLGPMVILIGRMRFFKFMVLSLQPSSVLLGFQFAVIKAVCAPVDPFR
jgi:hypothetical protein